MFSLKSTPGATGIKTTFSTWVAIWGWSIVASAGIYNCYTGISDPFHSEFLPGLVFTLLSGVMIYTHVDKLWTGRKFEGQVAWISEKVIRRGDEFHFTFKQRFRKTTDIESIGIFLVYRETVTIFEPFQKNKPMLQRHNFDRWQEGESVSGGLYQAGETLSETRSFTLPQRSMGIHHPFENRNITKIELSWIIKIRLDLGGKRLVWREYKIDVDPGPMQWPSVPNPHIEPTFDMSLVSDFADYRLGKILTAAFPHDIFCGKTMPYNAPEILLLENRTMLQLKVVKEQLEAEGVPLVLTPHQ